MSERDFFGCVVEKHLEVVPELRRLLSSYLDAVAPRTHRYGHSQVWGEDGAGALAYAMQALLILDRSAHDIFRRYLALRDGEHETYTTSVLAKEYVSQISWRDSEAIRFGVYYVLIRHRDGLAPESLLWNLDGLLDAAERRLTAGEFGEILCEEIDGFSVPFTWNNQNREYLYRSLMGALDPQKQYHRAILDVLSRQDAAKRQDLAAAMGRHTVH